MTLLYSRNRFFANFVVGVFLILGFLEIFFRQNFDWKLQNESVLVVDFLSKNFFGGNTHIAFTFAAYFGIKEFSTLLSNRKYIVKPIFIFMGIALSLAAVQVWHHLLPISHNKKLFISLLFPIYTSFHAIRQTYGISTQHLATIGKNTDQLKMIFYVFNIIYLFQVACVHLQSKFWHWSKISNLLNLVLAAFFVLILIYLIAQQPVNSRARNYLYRVFFFPLSQFSFFLTSAIGWIHGLEYFDIINKASIRSTKRNILVGSLVGSIFVLAIFTFYVLKLLSSSSYGVVDATNRVYLKFFAFLGYFLAFFHYLIDGTVFKMKSPEGRENMSHLIVAGH